MKRKKILAALLAMALLLGLLPATALAGECPSRDSVRSNGNHFWHEDGVIEATCTTPGYTQYECYYCGGTKKEQTSPALGHNWGGWTTTRQATCEAAGEEVRTCSRCGAKETRSTAKKEHTWGKWKTRREATCAKKGEEERKCSVCGAKETRDIKKKAHTYGDWTVRREPTCAEEGERVRTCEKCSHEDVQAIEKLPHSFGDWTTNKEPTCTAEGEETATCQVCGHVQTQPVAMLPHAFGEWVEIAPLTDWSIGIWERTCAMCDLTEHKETEPAGTHKKGDKGEGVKDLQDALNDAGYDSGKADGIFGKKTESAVKQAEASLGKPEDGIGWPGIMPMLWLGGKEHPEDILLTAWLTSTADWYPTDATATFAAEFENTSGLDLEEWTLYQMSGNDMGFTEWKGVASGGMLAAGDKMTVTDLEYTVGSTDEECGGLEVSFYVSAKAAGGKTLYSNQADVPVETEASGPAVILSADKAVAVKFVDGGQVDVPMTLYNDSDFAVEVDTISCGGGYPYSVSAEPWMSQPLEPHMDYHFTFTTEIMGFEVGEDWTYRTVKVNAHASDTGKAASDGAHAFIVPLVEGPSVNLIQEDLTGMGGDVGDVLRLPMVAVNNGTVDLTDITIDDGFPKDYADYDTSYNALLAAGDSFKLDFFVEVLAQDANLCAATNTDVFYRYVKITGAAVDTKAPATDEDEIGLHFTGPMPGLSLKMTQTTPDQPTWSPDGSGHIADIHYDCVATNDGERPLLLDSLLFYMYPSTEAGTVAEDLGKVLLLPGEDHDFKATLPIGTSNITPGSGSETIDGVITAEFAVLGLNPDDQAGIASSDTHDNTFEYKVKLDGYDWTPPEIPKPAISIGVEDTTGKGGPKGSYLPLAVTITNSGNTELKDVWLEDNSYSGDLSANDSWTIPLYAVASFPAGDSFDASYVVNISADDETYAGGHSGTFVRGLIVHATDVATGEEVTDEVKFDLLLTEAPVEEGPAISIGVEDTTGKGGPKDSYLPLAVTITNTGDTELKDVWLDTNSCGGALGTTDAWVIPSDVIASFPAHASFDASYVVDINGDDANYANTNGGFFDRWLIVHAIDVATGKEVQDDVKFKLELLKPEASITAVKFEVSAAGPEGYELNDSVDCVITITNNNDVQLDNVEVYDHKNGDPTGVWFATIPTLLPHESKDVHYIMLVGEADTNSGVIKNYATVHWTDPYTDEAREDTTNEIEIKVKQPDTIYGGLTVKKTRVGDPGNGSFYVENEDVEFMVEVTNDSGQKLSVVTVYDPLCSGGTLAEFHDVPDGDTVSASFKYTVTAADVASLTEITNVANVHATGADGKKYIVLSNPATAPIGEIFGVVVDCAVTKVQTTATPARGFYIEGETIGYDITVTNTGEVPFDDMTAYDTLKYTDGGELGSEMGLAPSDSRTYHFEYTVDYWDCAIGTVINEAYVIYWVSGYPTIVWSEPVESPTGFETPPEPTINPGDGRKSIDGGDDEPEPDPKDHDGKPGPDYCRRTLTGVGDGRRAYTLDFCSEHIRTWNTVNAMMAFSGSDGDQTALWQTAIDLWTEALNDEYRSMLVQAAPQDIPALMNEQAMFYLQVNCRRDALAMLNPNDPSLPLKQASEMLMNKCADLCYERHTAPEDRVDSLNGTHETLPPARPGEICGRETETTATGTAYVEAACAAHAVIENDARMTAVISGNWPVVKRLWLAQLDILTNARYMAADEAGRKTIAAERVSFGNWLKAREAMLALAYPDRPEIVEEMLTDAIRARVIDLCGD